MKTIQFPYQFKIRSIWLLLPILIVVITLLRHGLGIDRVISDMFYHDGTWLWPKQNHTLTFWLHNFLKFCFVAIGIFCLIVCIASLKYNALKPYSYGAFMVMLSLIIIPIVVARLKAETHIFCPSRLERYHGDVPDRYRYLKLPKSLVESAKCFPAAHSSPGFALMILGVMATTRKKKIIGYGIGIIAGMVLTIIQIGRGEHYFTHSVASFLIALWIVHVLDYVVSEFLNHYRLCHAFVNRRR
jgi:membrane-associated PAP2 superfamily phosphatase